jgi:hypothetical protein
MGQDHEAAMSQLFHNLDHVIAHGALGLGLVFVVGSRA